MKIFITDEQKTELERLHDTSRDKRVCERIKAILLASEGWNSAMIAQALRLHQTTIERHISDYLNHRKLKPENGGKETTGDEPILFLDAVHPTQATKLSYGWIRTGHKKAVTTTGSRTRLNILGALNLNDIGGRVFQEYETINDFNMSRFFMEIRKAYPNYGQKIHVILDGAGYNKSKLVKDWAYVANIELHYLPPYSPNLNAIERLWKVMNEHARNNRYFASKHDFRDAIFNFFTTTLPEIADSLTSRIHDRFQLLKTAS